jgi:hypothetical protein
MLGLGPWKKRYRRISLVQIVIGEVPRTIPTEHTPNLLVTLGGYRFLLRWCVLFLEISCIACDFLLQVLRYDAGSLAVLRDVSDFRSYITQNSTHEVQKRRRVRISLRALEGQLVLWPYEHIQVGEFHTTSNNLTKRRRSPSEQYRPGGLVGGNTQRNDPRASGRPSCAFIAEVISAGKGCSLAAALRFS